MVLKFLLLVGLLRYFPDKKVETGYISQGAEPHIVLACDKPSLNGMLWLGKCLTVNFFYPQLVIILALLRRLLTPSLVLSGFPQPDTDILICASDTSLSGHYYATGRTRPTRTVPVSHLLLFFIIGEMASSVCSPVLAPLPLISSHHIYLACRYRKLRLRPPDLCFSLIPKFIFTIVACSSVSIGLQARAKFSFYSFYTSVPEILARVTDLTHSLRSCNRTYSFVTSSKIQ